MSSTRYTPRTGATDESTAIPLGRTLRAGATAIAAAVVANVVWAIVAAVTDMPDAFLPLATVWPTVIFTALFLAIGVGVFALLVRASQRPIARFWQIAVGALLLSFLSPLAARGQDGATTAGILTLEVMHLVAFLTFVPLFTALVRET